MNLHQSEKDFFDHLWMTLVLLVVGGNFDHPESLCGLVASVRSRKLRVAIWIKNASNTDVVKDIGNIFSNVCLSGGSEKKNVVFAPHNNNNPDAKMQL